jgi:polyhydroxyalkanoate synthesis regulator phasin
MWTAVASVRGVEGMMHLLRKAALAGLGIVTLKEEKAKEIIADLVEQGELSREEGAKLIKELRERMEKNRSELEKRIGTIIKRAVERMNLASREELRQLAEEQRQLLARIERLEKQRGEEVGEDGSGRR